MGCVVVNDLIQFKAESGLIVCNRYDNRLKNVEGKLFRETFLALTD